MLTKQPDLFEVRSKKPGTAGLLFRGSFLITSWGVGICSGRALNNGTDLATALSVPAPVSWIHRPVLETPRGTWRTPVRKATGPALFAPSNKVRLPEGEKHLLFPGISMVSVGSSDR